MAKRSQRKAPSSQAAAPQTTIEHSIDFYAHHSPFGANASFTLGRLGRGGGFGLDLGRPAEQDIFVAYARKGEPARALPFFKGSGGASLAAFAMTAPGTDTTAQIPDPTQDAFYRGWQIFPEAEIERDLAWASDSWAAGDLTFRILSPFGPVANPDTADAAATRLAVLPALLAEIELDNSASDEPAWAFFGLAPNDGTGVRTLSHTTQRNLLGIAGETRFALAARPDGDAVQEVQPWFIDQMLSTGKPEVHGLPKQGGLLLHVEPRTKKTFTVALAFYRGGVVTSGIEASYFYTRYYSCVEDVLDTALARAEELKALAAQRDRELRDSKLNPSQQFLLAHATHSYYGSSQLLDSGGRALWVVNEGEYQMINTFDLTVDHLYFELRYHPWAVRNALDLFCDRYFYYDEVQDVLRGREKHTGGLSFVHDMGICNQFSPPHCSSYEIPDRTGGFSFMTHEQLVNWVLCASSYVLTQKDDGWLFERQGTFRETFRSLLHRDHTDPTKRNGVMGYDTAKCGKTGQEITTYDSLDASLGQSRNNLYLAVKTWASYVALAKVFDALGDPELASAASAMADRSAATVVSQFDKKEQFIPAVFNENVDSRIIPAVEGLVFPWLLGDRDATSEKGRYAELITALKQHIRTILVPGVCIDSESNGWKMSSTSHNTWLSKIALSQFVVRKVLGLRFRGQEEEWDSAHSQWQQVGCADWACTDQIRSYDGKDLGSRYYPRAVTSVLWLEE